MKVKELIAKLQQMDQEALVVHRGYEDGLDAAGDNPREDIVYRRIDASWYNGEFDTVTDWTKYDIENYDKSNPIKAVII